VESSHRSHDVLAGTQVEVVSISEDDLSAGAFHLTGMQAAHGAVGSDRHEGRRFHGPVGQYKSTGARVAVAPFWRELEHGGKL